MFGLGVGISTVFEIFGHFLFKGGLIKGGRTTRMVITYKLFDASWYKEQEYIQFRGGKFNSFQDIKNVRYCAPPPTLREDDLIKKRAFVLCLKAFMLILDLWAH
jgi:hypothetical protein